MNKKAFGVSIFIRNDDGKILSIARRDNPNESEIEAAIRETKEECGLDIFDLVEVFRRNEDEPNESCTFTCSYKGEPSSQPGEPECSWQSPEVLMKGIFGDYNRNLFTKLGII